MTAASMQFDQSAERRAKRFWILLVLVLFAIQIAIGTVAIRLAVSDPSAVVVPQYHDAALNWDDTRAAQLASQRMGWSIDIAASSVADTRGMRAVEVNVRDESDQGVDGLKISAKIYHHARAAEAQNVVLSSVGNGQYLVMSPMPHIGLWQIDLAIDGASEPMIEQTTLEITTPKSEN